MQACFPASSNESSSTEVYDHFGSAPLFLLVDSENQNAVEISNQDLHHAHGAFCPMSSSTRCPPSAFLKFRLETAARLGGYDLGAQSPPNYAYPFNPDFYSSKATAISESGIVIGSSYSINGHSRGFTLTPVFP